MRKILLILLACVILLYVGFYFFGTSPLVIQNSDPIPMDRSLPDKSQQKVIRILALDGGGIRGIIPLMVLREIEGRTGKPINELFDFIAGTSTGAIISTGFTFPNDQGLPRYSAEDILEIYKKVGHEALDYPLWRKILTLYGTIGPMGRLENLHKLLRKEFGKVRFSQLLNNIAFLGYEVKGRKPIIFTNWKAPLTVDMLNTNLWVADLLTALVSDIPIFPPTLIRNKEGSITHVLADGGVTGPNPALVALTVASTIYPGKEYLVVSLGTGYHFPKESKTGTEDWGVFQWSIPMLEIQLYANALRVKYQMDRLAQADTLASLNHFRFDTPIKAEYTSPFNTSPQFLQVLEEYGQSIIREKSETLNELIPHLLDPQLPLPPEERGL